jgi:PHD/YefM family antitoxin component YafN of YafNO toxin-antitoxin module
VLRFETTSDLMRAIAAVDAGDSLPGSDEMNAIPAQEIKQRGISAVDKLLERGPDHVISRNRPKYVVMDETQYADLMDDLEEASLVRIRASLVDIAAGRVRRFETAEELVAHIMAYGTDGDED